MTLVVLLLTALVWERAENRADLQSELATNTYYLAPNGSDQNPGTLEQPWQTLAHGLKNAAPGDLLYLRGGTYYEHRITVKVSGTDAAPITVQSYPGERAVIDGGVPFFAGAPNSEWELVNADLQLYRSRRTFPEEYEFVRAWLIDDGVQLVEYAAAENLEATHYGPLNGMKPTYVGPGLQWRSDGHLYIRLTYNPNDLTDAAGNPITPIPQNVDPNHNRIAVFFSSYLLRLDGVGHLHLIDLDLAHARTLLEVRNGSHDLVLKQCRMRFGSQGVLIRDPVDTMEISDCEFSNGIPDYIYWTDVKNRKKEIAEAYPEFQSTAINGPMVNSALHHNLIRNTFDGIDLEEGSRDTRILENTFKQVRDDAINLSRGIGNVEVGHNLIWHGMGGIANLSSDMPAGHVYIHHNVIDNSAYQRGGRPGNYRADNWPPWNIGSPFPGHDDGRKDSWWKLYNNTVVTRQDTGHRWSSAGPEEVTGNPEKYVLNNIFYVIDERVIFRNDQASEGSHYDGNVFFRGRAESLPLFYNFGNGKRYESLQEFQATSGTDWEVHGMEVDPGFDLAALNDPTFDPATIWEHYRPTNSALARLSSPYTGKEWPETQGITYPGALPGSTSRTTFLPYIISN